MADEARSYHHSGGPKPRMEDELILRRAKEKATGTKKNPASQEPTETDQKFIIQHGRVDLMNAINKMRADKSLKAMTIATKAKVTKRRNEIDSGAHGGDESDSGARTTQNEPSSAPQSATKTTPKSKPNPIPFNKRPAEEREFNARSRGNKRAKRHDESRDEPERAIKHESDQLGGLVSSQPIRGFMKRFGVMSDAPLIEIKQYEPPEDMAPIGVWKPDGSLERVVLAGFNAKAELIFMLAPVTRGWLQVLPTDEQEEQWKTDTKRVLPWSKKLFDSISWFKTVWDADSEGFITEKELRVKVWETVTSADPDVAKKWGWLSGYETTWLPVPQYLAFGDLLKNMKSPNVFMGWNEDTSIREIVAQVEYLYSVYKEERVDIAKHYESFKEQLSNKKGNATEIGLFIQARHLIKAIWSAQADRGDRLFAARYANPTKWSTETTYHDEWLKKWGIEQHGTKLVSSAENSSNSLKYYDAFGGNPDEKKYAMLFQSKLPFATINGIGVELNQAQVEKIRLEIEKRDAELEKLFIIGDDFKRQYDEAMDEMRSVTAIVHKQQDLQKQVKELREQHEALEQRGFTFPDESNYKEFQEQLKTEAEERKVRETAESGTNHHETLGEELDEELGADTTTDTLDYGSKLRSFVNEEDDEDAIFPGRSGFSSSPEPVLQGTKPRKSKKGNM